MPELDFRFIGTGNAFAPAGLCWNGFLVNGVYLFETPPQTLQALNAIGVDANDLDGVVISHHHGDHFLGLPFLLLQWKWSKRTRPVRIVGPRGTRELAIQITESVYPGTIETTHDIEWDECEPGQATSIGALQLETLGMLHDELLSGALGFAAALNGRRFGYTGDTAMCDSAMELARRSEVLIAECSSRSGRIPVHMNLVDDMPRLRQAMSADAHLLLTHLGAGVNAGDLKNTRIAEQGRDYRF